MEMCSEAHLGCGAGTYITNGGRRYRSSTSSADLLLCCSSSSWPTIWRFEVCCVGGHSYSYNSVEHLQDFISAQHTVAQTINLPDSMLERRSLICAACRRHNATFTNPTRRRTALVLQVSDHASHPIRSVAARRTGRRTTFARIGEFHSSVEGAGDP